MSKQNLHSKDDPNICIISQRSGQRRYAIWFENKKRISMPYARWVWQKWFGSIPEGYYIHHKDGNTLNDSIENLVLMKSGEHQKYHLKDNYRHNPDMRAWLCFLRQHNRLDTYKKPKPIPEWDYLEGNTDGEKLTYLYSRFNINQTILAKISGFHESILSRAMANKRNLSQKSKNKIIDGIIEYQMIPQSETKSKIKFNPDLVGIITNLEIIRRKQGLSRHELADLSGTSRTLIYHIECMGYVGVKQKTLDKLAITLGVSSDVLAVKRR